MTDGTTYRIGIDVGGTFTDLFLHCSDGAVATYKTLSTPEDPSVGVIDGLRRIAEARRVPLEAFMARLSTIVHGTTVTTNAVLTRGGARTGLVTTEGVRDALEMRRGIREEQYDNHYTNVEPLVPRSRRRPVRGRLDFRGRQLAPLCLEDVRDAARLFAREGVAAVAVCFLNSFANGEHERAAAAVLREELPNAFLSVSSEVLPTIRFYDRVSTTVLDAYTGPVLDRYLDSLTRRLAAAGFGGVLLIMQSSGGVAVPEVTRRRPAATLLSGPAAGPAAALAFGELLDTRSCIVMDMGGTSFDASLVRDGEVALKPQGDIERLRIAMPMLDIVTIGAGGGSIGWIDAGGLLRMGPASAGADPGPACYGRGGDRPTCTDADLVLGYLDPDFFAGGQMRLDSERARAAIEAEVAAPLGLDVSRAAVGMYRVINVNMAHGVREITVKRGLDPREFPLVVAGGAGALHACEIARELDIATVLVPPTASILCATGMLLTDLAHDLVRSCVGTLADIEEATLDAVVASMIEEGEAHLDHEAVPPDRREHRIALDLRYLKQYHEVTVPVSREALACRDLASIGRAFHAAHDRLYGYRLEAEGTPLELINVRVRSLGRVERPAIPRVETGSGDTSAARKGTRRAYVPERERFEEVSVFDGHGLLAGDRVPGPALVERVDTTIFVGASYDARIDPHGTAVLQRKGGAR